MNMTPPDTAFPRSLDEPGRKPTAAPGVLLPDPAAMQRRAGQATRFLKSLANEKRLMILCHLVGGDRSVGELERLLGMRQPALSQQLAKLREDGLVAADKQARTVRYRLADPHVTDMVSLLHRLFCDDGLGACVPSAADGTPSAGPAPRPP